VVPPVFKTGERCAVALAGSIPVRLRYLEDQALTSARILGVSDVKWSVCAIALTAGLWLATFLTDNAAVFMVAIVVTVGVLLTSPVADAVMLGSGHKKHSSRQPPPPPAPPTPNFMRGPA
jgi:hypothetical protein